MITSIYPNPTSGLFTITTNEKELDVEIYSNLGKLVYKREIKKGSQQIDLRHKAKGVYHMKLQQNIKRQYKNSLFSKRYRMNKIQTIALFHAIALVVYLTWSRLFYWIFVKYCNR